MREKEEGKKPLVGNLLEEAVNSHLASQMFGYPYSFISNLPSAEVEKDRVLEMVEGTELAPLLPKDRFPTPPPPHTLPCHILNVFSTPQFKVIGGTGLASHFQPKMSLPGHLLPPATHRHVSV